MVIYRRITISQKMVFIHTPLGKLSFWDSHHDATVAFDPKCLQLRGCDLYTTHLFTYFKPFYDLYFRDCG